MDVDNGKDSTSINKTCTTIWFRYCRSTGKDLDAIVEKLNTTFQQELKDEVEAENFFLN